MEKGYQSSSNMLEPTDALLTSCSESAGLSKADLISCYAGSNGDDATVAEAMLTPSHAGVPWVVVDGKAAKESYEPDALINSVQSAMSARAGSSFLAFPHRPAFSE